MERLPAMECMGRHERSRRDSMPRVDGRLVLFTVCDVRLMIALHQRRGCQSLPRRDPTFNESLDAAAMRILENEIGTGERYQEQLYSMSHASQGDWTVSVTYLALALARAGEFSADGSAWFSPSAPANLHPADRMNVDNALVCLRAKLGYTAIPFHLLAQNLTLREVQTASEAVFDRRVDKRTIRRRMHAGGLSDETGASRRVGSYRPARLYRLRAAHDAETFLTPTWAAQAELKAGNR